MNKSINESISHGLSSFQPSTGIVAKALRHLSQKQRKKLLSKNRHSKYAAIGILYEYVIYERLSELSRRSTCFRVIGKGADIPWKMRIAPKLGQDGLYYDRSGDIVARGNGQELAEFDMILTSKMNEIVFVEIKSSKNNLKDFDRLINYKKRLLSYLFNQPVSFILISSFDIRNKPTVKPTIITQNDHFVKTYRREDFCKIIKPVIIASHFIPKERNSNHLLSDLKTNKINYKEIHDLYRKKFIKALLKGKPVNFGGDSSLIKRLVMGKLSADSVMELLNKKKIMVQEKKLDLVKYNLLFSKIVLSLSIPDLRPVLYMKGVEKSVYLKMGPFTPLIFDFERNIFPRTAFYNWLDNIQLELNQNLLNQIMTKCLNTKICGSRRKAGEIPEITW